MSIGGFGHRIVRDRRGLLAPVSPTSPSDQPRVPFFFAAGFFLGAGFFFAAGFFAAGFFAAGFFAAGFFAAGFFAAGFFAAGLFAAGFFAAGFFAAGFFLAAGFFFAAGLLAAFLFAAASSVEMRTWQLGQWLASDQISEPQPGHARFGIVARLESGTSIKASLRGSIPQCLHAAGTTNASSSSTIIVSIPMQYGQHSSVGSSSLMRETLSEPAPWSLHGSTWTAQVALAPSLATAMVRSPAFGNKLSPNM
jgi:hypothetical protein